MKFELSTAFGTALTLHAAIAHAKHNNDHLDTLERRHQHSKVRHVSRAETGLTVEVQLEKRDGTCQWPSDAGLVAVSPKDANGGWAMSPDQECKHDSYCPYACPAGQVMAQWDPDATSYTYPQSMNGGAYCDKNGNVQKPFPNKQWCMDGTGAVGCKNKAASNVAFCQTVLPGNEAMLIPTNIESWAQLAVPGPSYWAGTAAHFYINPPGVSTEEACVWGSTDNPWGNWSPYVAGANTDHQGNTFVKLGWNPIYLEPATPFRSEMPTWGVEIVCEGGSCNGLPCGIDPSKNKVNEMMGGQGDGAGGANFCVVTVPKGVTANFEVFEEGNNRVIGGVDNAPNRAAAPSSSSSQSTYSLPESSAAPTTSMPPSSSSPSPPSSQPPTSSTPSPSSSASSSNAPLAPSSSSSSSIPPAHPSPASSAPSFSAMSLTPCSSSTSSSMLSLSSIISNTSSNTTSTYAASTASSSYSYAQITAETASLAFPTPYSNGSSTFVPAAPPIQATPSVSRSPIVSYKPSNGAGYQYQATALTLGLTGIVALLITYF